MTVICFCKACGRQLYERDQALRGGDVIEAHSFRALPGVQQPTAGDEARCPFCGADFAFAIGDRGLLGFCPVEDASA